MQIVTIPIEDVRVGDIDPATQLRVTHVLDRAHARYIRATLEGGRKLLDGYYGAMVEVIRKEKEGAA